MQWAAFEPAEGVAEDSLLAGARGRLCVRSIAASRLAKNSPLDCFYGYAVAP